VLLCGDGRPAALAVYGVSAKAARRWRDVLVSALIVTGEREGGATRRRFVVVGRSIKQRCEI
jgi:hypothetical protein